MTDIGVAFAWKNNPGLDKNTKVSFNQGFTSSNSRSRTTLVVNPFLEYDFVLRIRLLENNHDQRSYTQHYLLQSLHEFHESSQID